MAAGVLSLILYSRTLAPGLTWAHNGADGGDLLGAALTAGVPHPSGYPFYQLVLRGTLALAAALARRPDWAGNVLSAVSASLAIVFVVDLARCLLPHGGWGTASATVAGLTLAASPALWSQAVITEVYALNVLFVALLLWLLWQWQETNAGESGKWRWPVAFGLLFGLGLGNHISLLLLAPAAALLVWSGRQGPPLAMGLAGALGAGLLVYAYLPIAASGDPPINWGWPDSLSSLWWLVSGQLYADLSFGLPWHFWPARVVALANDVVHQFGIGGALLALVGLRYLDLYRHRWWQATGLVALVYALFAVGYNTADSYVYLLPAWCAVALWLAAGLYWVCAGLTDRLRRHARGKQENGLGGESRGAFPDWPRVGIALGMLVLPLWAVAANYAAMDLSRDREATDFVARALSAEQGAVILVATDEPTFALWYARYGLGERPDMVPLNVNLLGYRWYRQTVHNHHAGVLSSEEVAIPPPLPVLVTRLAGDRPLYRAEDLPEEVHGLVEQTEGVLVRLTPG